VVELPAALSAAAWIYLALGHGRFWRTKLLLLSAPSENVPGRRVAVVIPARDEAATIRQAVRSLASQDWAGSLDIYLVDDASSDGTGALAAEAGAHVVEARPLPPGWTGKLWALQQGVERAASSHPDYFLFTDADIVHASDSVRSLVARAEAGGIDLMSVMVRLNCESLAERLLVPAFVFFFFMLYPPRWIEQRERSTAGAAGGCILIRPEALSRAGGIEAIRSELIDDCSLASAVKRSGGSLWLGMSEGTRSIRLYPAFADMRRMISRTAFTQLRYSSFLLAGTVAGMALLYLLPVAAVMRGSWFGVLGWALMAALFAPIARFYRQPVFAGVLLPGIALFYLYATVESAVRYWMGTGGAWKGRNQAEAQRLPVVSRENPGRSRIP
jgi:hopene-associated glycosyltransferase HpnB